MPGGCARDQTSHSPKSPAGWRKFRMTSRASGGVMKGPTRSILTAGVAMVGACAIAIAPSVQPVPPPSPATPPIALTAAVQPALAQGTYLSQVVNWAEGIFLPSATTSFPAPPSVAAPAPTSAGSAIINVYNAIEPWVRYGFALAEYAVGWIPGIGWLAPQIGFFYNFGEAIVQSVVYNFANWIDGNVSLVQGLVNIGSDSFTALVNLGIAELNWILPPLPPIPPLPFAARPTTPLRVPTPVPDTAGRVSTARSGPVRLDKPLLGAPRDVATGVVNAQGSVHGALANATTGVQAAAGTAKKPHDARK